MADHHMTIEQIVAECERYWVDTRVPADVIPGLRATVVDRLREAQRAGRRPTKVVGRDLVKFAESLASAHRVPPPAHPPLSPAERAKVRRWDLLPAFGWMVPVVVLAGLVIAFGPKEDVVEDPWFWRWLWVGIAVVLGIGEMLTAGFFMLPFAIGAAIAAVLAWFEVTVAVQLLVFIVTSLISLAGLRRFAWSDREPTYSVGAKRFVNAHAIVIERIDRLTGEGKVRMETEEWRATTDGAPTIEIGADVRVVDVRGTRLVVEPIPPD